MKPKNSSIVAERLSRKRNIELNTKDLFIIHEDIDDLSDAEIAAIVRRDVKVGWDALRRTWPIYPWRRSRRGGGDR